VRDPETAVAKVRACEKGMSVDARFQIHCWDGVRSCDLCLPLHTLCTVEQKCSSTH